MTDAVAAATAAAAAAVVTDPASTPAAVTQPIIAQPAAPAAPAPEAIGEVPAVVASAPDAATTGSTFAYQETGDAGLDVALQFVGSLGIGPEHPAMVDAMDGKFDKIEAYLSAMGDKSKGWERMVNLAKSSYATTQATTTANQTAITSVVNEVAGSPEAWAQVKAWAGANADPSEKAAINAMLSAGPLEARAAAALLTAQYRSAGGTVVQPAAAVVQNAAPAAPTGNGALSPSEYTKAVSELKSRIGSFSLDASPEYAALKTRRIAWQG